MAMSSLIDTTNNTECAICGRLIVRGDGPEPLPVEEGGPVCDKCAWLMAVPKHPSPCGPWVDYDGFIWPSKALFIMWRSSLTRGQLAAQDAMIERMVSGL